MRTVNITNENETRAFGLALAKELTPGKVLALVGDLGTGKTTLTRYIAEGLGILDGIQSPTFTIIREHRTGRLPLYHFDVYRLNDPEELLELGYEDYFFGEGITVVEWADKISRFMPEDTLWIHIDYGESEDGRVYTCTF